MCCVCEREDGCGARVTNRAARERTFAFRRVLVSVTGSSGLLRLIITSLIVGWSGAWAELDEIQQGRWRRDESWQRALPTSITISLPTLALEAWPFMGVPLASWSKLFLGVPRPMAPAGSATSSETS